MKNQKFANAASFCEAAREGWSCFADQDAHTAQLGECLDEAPCWQSICRGIEIDAWCTLRLRGESELERYRRDRHD